MALSKLSERAQKILVCLQLDSKVRFIRQQTFAEQFGCSRRTIGRALKELKEAGLLVDLNKRHENRCKMYQVREIPTPSTFAKASAASSPTRGEEQLKLYRQTFEANFRDWPDWEKYYPQVTWELRNETDMNLLFRQTFDKLYVIREESERQDLNLRPLDPQSLPICFT